MLDIMYDLPEQPKGSKYMVDEKMVADGINGGTFKMPESKSA